MTKFEVFILFLTLAGFSASSSIERRAVEGEFAPDCFHHECTDELLGCRLTVDADGCSRCECAQQESVCEPIPCSSESLECPGELALDAYGCHICECAEIPEVIEPEEGVLTECEQQRKDALDSNNEIPEGPFIPECDEAGLFVAMQCYWEECWCVMNPHGNEVEGTRVSIAERETMECDSEAGKKPPPTAEPTKSPPKEIPEIPEVIEPEEGVLTECEQQRKDALDSNNEIPEGPFVPECDEAGLFVAMQCYWEECWCVMNPHGNEVEETRVSIAERETMECDSEAGKKPPPTAEPTKSPPKEIPDIEDYETEFGEFY